MRSLVFALAMVAAGSVSAGGAPAGAYCRQKEDPQVMAISARMAAISPRIPQDGEYAPSKSEMAKWAKGAELKRLQSEYLTLETAIFAAIEECKERQWLKSQSTASVKQTR